MVDLGIARNEKERLALELLKAMEDGTLGGDDRILVYG
jgi:hypothetical protein